MSNYQWVIINSKQRNSHSHVTKTRIWKYENMNALYYIFFFEGKDNLLLK